MDPDLAKLTLSAYRPGTEDVRDPHFAEALSEAERNPELAAWFAEAQRFDAEMAALLEGAPVPAEVRDRLGRMRHETRLITVSFAPWILAAAALIVGAFFLGRVTVPQLSSSSSEKGSGDNLALQAISYTERMPALQFVCFDANEVRTWINHKSTALNMGPVIDKPIPDMHMVGSSAATWEGRPVMMVAVQNGRRMAMLYIMRAEDFPTAAEHAGEVVEKNGWVSKTGLRGSRLFVLTARGTRADLDFPMPL